MKVFDVKEESSARKENMHTKYNVFRSTIREEGHVTCLGSVDNCSNSRINTSNICSSTSSRNSSSSSSSSSCNTSNSRIVIDVAAAAVVVLVVVVVAAAAILVIVE
jgi:hypothetical protein